VKLNPEDVGSQAGGCQACCVFTVFIGQSFHNLSTACKFLSFVDFDRYNFPGVGKQTFFCKVRKSKICKFLGPLRHRKLTNFLCLLVRESHIRNIITCESQFRKFVHNTAQLCRKTTLNTAIFVRRIEFTLQKRADVVKGIHMGTYGGGGGGEVK
jgi:hypothetical protein